MSFSFKDTTATKRIFNMRKRIRAVAGGTSASKTISILIWLIDYCQSHRNKLVSVVSESYPHLLGGAIRDFESIMRDRNYWKDEQWIKSPRCMYTFETGSKIEFYSPDTYGKAHGPRRDVLFINEANNLDYSIADQLIIRTREIIWMDWNPSQEFWFYTEMLNRRSDVDFITLTYLDNEALDINTIKEIESHRGNSRWWTVYGLGQLGEVEGKIYKGWNVIDTIPHEARLVRRGLDYGFTNDPAVIEDLYLYNGGYIVDELLYQKGVSNKGLADVILNSLDPTVLVVADSAEPKSIDEMRSYGVNIIGSVKGPGSVMQGIQFVQDQKISVTQRSIKTLNAYRNYFFMKDKNNKIINEPDDTIHEWSNPMDAIRYAIVSMGNTGEMVSSTHVSSIATNPYTRNRYRLP